MSSSRSEPGARTTGARSTAGADADTGERSPARDGLRPARRRHGRPRRRCYGGLWRGPIPAGFSCLERFADPGQSNLPNRTTADPQPPARSTHMASPSFADLGVSRPVVDALARRDITAPFAVQELVMADALAGRDLLVKSPTGSGKTLAFGIPLVDRLAANAPRHAALVLAPTRELATQIAQEIEAPARARGLAVAAVYGGAGIERQARNARKAHVIVATPGRLE